LRQDHQQFVNRDVVILVIGPEDASKFADYFGENQLPFAGLPDPKHRVLKLYGQEIKIFKLGRMPAQILVDKEGIVRFVHYGDSMRDIPANKEILKLVDKMDEESEG
jgi:peroxiredoxin Q/BCP